MFRNLTANLPLTPYVRETVWGGTERGYTDFPAYAERSPDDAA